MADHGDGFTLAPGAAEGLHVLIVEARYYHGIADALLEGAVQALDAAGATHERVTVPGSLEIPGAIVLAAEDGSFDAYVALGCVIRGETTHYEIVSEQSARAIMDLTLEGLSVGNGIITVENEEQAWARARVSGQNKGGGAAVAALALALLKQRFEDNA